MNKSTCLVGGTVRCKFGLLSLRYKHPGRQGVQKYTLHGGGGITPGVLLTQVVCRVCSVNAEFLACLPPHALYQLFPGVGCGDLFLVGAWLRAVRLTRSPTCVVSSASISAVVYKSVDYTRNQSKPGDCEWQSQTTPFMLGVTARTKTGLLLEC